MLKGRKFALAAAAALFVLLATGWWFGSPWWTLWRMREAAQAGDSDALAAYIDFPAVRTSTREQLGLGPLGGLLAGPAVDALVSPKSLELALGSGRGKGSASSSSGGGPGSGGKAPEVELVRAGASEFRVRSGRRHLVFRRHGLAWKLVEVSLRRPDAS